MRVACVSDPSAKVPGVRTMDVMRDERAIAGSVLGQTIGSAPPALSAASDPSTHAPTGGSARRGGPETIAAPGGPETGRRRPSTQAGRPALADHRARAGRVAGWTASRRPMWSAHNGAAARG